MNTNEYLENTNRSERSLMKFWGEIAMRTTIMRERAEKIGVFFSAVYRTTHTLDYWFDLSYCEVMEASIQARHRCWYWNRQKIQGNKRTIKTLVVVVVAVVAAVVVVVEVVNEKAIAGKWEKQSNERESYATATTENNKFIYLKKKKNEKKKKTELNNKRK